MPKHPVSQPSQVSIMRPPEASEICVYARFLTQHVTGYQHSAIEIPKRHKRLRPAHG